MNAQEIDNLIPEWTKLLKSLKTDIDDEFRASDDPDDNTPGMQVTFGFTPSFAPSDEDGDCSWSYQTGDNSFTGAAYGHQHWGVISLYRDSDASELANDIADQIAESVCF